jgi:hypothetical protein
LVLAVFYGFTAREIGELDGVPLGTVKTRIRSAMLKLRSQLKVSDDRQSAECRCSGQPPMIVGSRTVTRRYLSQGQGAYFLAAPLQGSQGRVGTVFGYQGRPSWLMLTMEPSTRIDGRFQVQVVTRDGRYLPVGDAVIGGAERTWGTELPVDLSDVHELRFMGSDERIAFTATFDTASPWD